MNLDWKGPVIDFTEGRFVDFEDIPWPTSFLGYSRLAFTGPEISPKTGDTEL